MKKIIVLSGPANVGKSKTIKLVYERLISKFTCVEVSPEREAREAKLITENEVRVILDMNGIRVGIESRGDNKKHVTNALALFAEHRCQIVLLATRTGGGTIDAVDEFCQKNSVKPSSRMPIAKKREVEASSYGAANANCATTILVTISGVLA